MKRIINIFIMFLFVLGLSACSTQEGGDTKTRELITTEKTVSENKNSLDLHTDVPIEYAAVLEQYHKIVNIMTSDEIFNVYDGKRSLPCPDGVDFDDWTGGFLEWASVPARYGYLVKDINGDGNAELFWVREDHEILLAFTLSEGKPIGLFSSRPRDRVYLSDSGKLVNFKSGGADKGTYVVMSLPLKSDCLMVEEIVEYDKLLNESGEYVFLYHKALWEGTLNYLDLDDGKYEVLEKIPMDQETFDAFREMYSQMSFPTQVWKQTPIHFMQNQKTGDGSVS